MVDEDTKKFNLSPLLSCKELWDFNKKEECNNIIKNWQIMFQVLDFKDTHFLNLLNEKPCTIKPSYVTILRVSQVKEPCIELTQENSIENSVQDCLSYILISNGLCKLFLAYSKWPCVCLKGNICIPCCMISFPECSISFYMLCNL